MLRFILEFVVPENAQEDAPDLTPLAAKRLCNSLFGRSGSQSILVYVFGRAGRVHRSATCSPKTIEAIAALYRSDAERYWNSTLATIERVKHTYRAKKSETPDPVIRPYALMLMYASISFKRRRTYSGCFYQRRTTGIGFDGCANLYYRSDHDRYSVHM
nr:hypothetical protein [Escherichia coli]